METSSSAVIQTVDAGFFTKPPRAHPSRVYVVSYRDGSIRSFSGAPTIADRISSKLFYLVDTGDQHVANTCTVTSASDAYSFSVELSATWRVTDPETAVLANLSDGNGLVLGTLQDTVWQIARGFRPDQAIAAENAVRARLAGEIRLASGITVLHAVARFRADAAVTGAVKDIDTEAHQALLERQRKAALDELFDGSEASALALQLLRHPNETATVLGTLKDNREKETALKLAMLTADREHYLALLDRALANDLINDDDAQPLRDLLFGQAGGGLTGSTTMVPIASKPPLSLPPGVAAGTAAPAPSFGASNSASGPGAQAQAPSAASPVAQGWVVEDVVVTSPAEDADPSAGQAAAGSGAGGVSGWKQIKRPGQG
jgi:hypothetical protein